MIELMNKFFSYFSDEFNVLIVIIFLVVVATIIYALGYAILEFIKILIGGYQVWRDGEYYEDGEWKTKQCK